MRRCALTVASAFLLATPIAWACGHCVKDILSPADFDRRAWESSERVFVAIVTAAEPSRMNEHMLEIDYRVDVEEVLKGVVDDFGQRLYTTQSAIPIGRCSSTRVIEGIAAASGDEVRETLSRVRRWRDDL